MNNVDGINKISKDELNEKRELILGAIGENLKSKQTTEKLDNFKTMPVIEKTKKIDDFTTKPVVEKNEVVNIIKHINKPKLEVKKTEKKIPEKVIPKKEKIQKAKPEKEMSKKIVPKKQIHWAKIFSNTKKHCHFVLSKIKKALEKIVFTLVISFFGTIIIYFILFLLIINFKIDNHFFRFVEKYLPVPAMIINNKVIDYYSYIDLKNNSKDKKDLDIKYELIRDITATNLSRKYRTSDPEMLNKLIVNDFEVNNVSLSRIKKIKQLIDDGGDFDQIIGKYGEKRDSITINNSDINNYEYGEKVKQLAVGQVSNIIFTSNGYYIFKCHDKNADQISLGYVFVNAKSFENYINEITKSIYFISFVE